MESRVHSNMQRDFCSTGKTKATYTRAINMEYYSCSKAMQPNCERKDREKTQPVRIKELLEPSGILRSSKKGPLREKSKPERLTLAISDRKAIGSASIGNGSQLYAKNTRSESKVHEKTVRRKLNLNFGSPKPAVTKPTNVQTNTAASNKRRGSFLIPPNTIRNMHLHKHSQEKNKTLDSTQVDKHLSLNNRGTISTINEVHTNSVILHNHIDRLVPDEKTMFTESEQSETICRSIENADVNENVVSQQTNDRTKFECRTSLLGRYSNCNTNKNMSRTQYTQKSYSQLQDLDLAFGMSSLPVIGEQEDHNLYSDKVQDAVMEITTLKHTQCNECQKKISTRKAALGTIKSVVQNLMHSTEENLNQLKLVLSSIEEMSVQQEDKSAEMMLSVMKDDQIISSSVPISISTRQEYMIDCTVPEVSCVMVDKEIQVEMYCNSNDENNGDEPFEIIDSKDLPQYTSKNADETVSDNNYPVVPKTDTDNANFERVENVEQSFTKENFKKKDENLISPPKNDSFLSLETELNILHTKPIIQDDLNVEVSEVNISNAKDGYTGKFEKSFKEYMLLKSDLNCLETPNVKKFRSFYGRDTKSVPSSMHKTYMSSKVLASIENLYAESPDLSH